MPHPSGNPYLAEMPSMHLGSFRVEVSFESPLSSRRDGACLCLKVHEGECFIVGSGCSLRFFSEKAEEPNLDFTCIEEGVFDQGIWKPGRRLNGDEAATLSLEKPSALRVRFIPYP